MTTYERVFAGGIGATIFDVDFSPDSSPSLVSADVDNYTATIWDIAAHKKVQSLGHGMQVLTAKYSPQGDWVVIASDESVQVWDSDDGCLLVGVKMALEPMCVLLWSNGHNTYPLTPDSVTQNSCAWTT